MDILLFDEGQKIESVLIEDVVGTDSLLVPEVYWNRLDLQERKVLLFANVVSHKNKIYVIGGMEKQGINYVASKKTESYDPYLDQWTTLSDMPVANQLT